MVKRQKTNKCFSKFLVIIFVIITLDLLGISYAVWSEELSMEVSVSTGHIDPYFSSCMIIDKIPGTGGGLTAEISEDGCSILIKGTVNKGYEGELYYYISDNGSIPADYCGEYKMDIKPEIVERTEPEAVTDQEAVIDPEAVADPEEAGIYEFTVNLPFTK